MTSRSRYIFSVRETGVGAVVVGTSGSKSKIWVASVARGRFEGCGGHRGGSCPKNDFIFSTFFNRARFFRCSTSATLRRLRTRLDQTPYPHTAFHDDQMGPLQQLTVLLGACNVVRRDPPPVDPGRPQIYGREARTGNEGEPRVSAWSEDYRNWLDSPALRRVLRGAFCCADLRLPLQAPHWVQSRLGALGVVRAVGRVRLPAGPCSLVEEPAGYRFRACWEAADRRCVRDRVCIPADLALAHPLPAVSRRRLRELRLEPNKSRRERNRSACSSRSRLRVMESLGTSSSGSW